MQTYLKKNNSKELILLFNGWGMDEKPFMPIISSCDILFISNYNELDFSFNFSKYKKITLIAFSAGVFMAGYLQYKLPKIDLKIAVNGISNLFDKNEGIESNILFEMKKITLENAIGFREKLIDKKIHLKLFNENQPSRTLEDSLNELSMLEKYYNKNLTTPLNFDKIYIGENDKIISPERQLKFWGNNKNIKKINGGHFLFYNFESFNDFINL